MRDHRQFTPAPSSSHASVLPVRCYVVSQVARADAFKALTGLGLPPWQAVGSLELIDAINAGAGAYFHEDFNAITGKAATSIQQWVAAVKGGFVAPAPAPAAAPAAAAEPAAAEGAVSAPAGGAGAAVSSA